MTNFEWKNPRFKANPGAAAFLAGVHIQNNPYQSKYQREQWERGYRAAKRYTESGSTAFYKPRQEEQPRRFERPVQSQNQNQDQTPRKPLQPSYPHPRRPQHPASAQNLRPGVHKGVAAANQTGPRPNRKPVVRTERPAERPVMNSRRIDAFNNKFRTAV